MEQIYAVDSPVEGWMCLARLTNPVTNESILAASVVLPWRGITAHWRQILNPEMTYADVFRYVLDYIVKRVTAERRVGENVILGGDFNQGLSGRNYVGTHQGRADMQDVLDHLDFQAATAHLPASINTHPAIDHILVPLGWSIGDDKVVHRPTHHEKRLSDHALYVVTAS